MARAITGIISVLIFTMTAAIFTQVMTRYVLHISLPFLQFVIAFSMSWLTMLGAATGIYRREHFAINVFSGREETPLAKVAYYIREGAILLVILSFCYSGYLFAQMGFTKEEPSTGLPEIYTYASFLAGSVMMLFFFFKVNWTKGGAK